MCNSIIRRCAFQATVLAALAASVTVGAQELKPGLWEISTAMQMQGMTMPATTFKHCLSAKDIAAGKQHSMGDKDGKCTVSNLKVAGASYGFDIACNSPEMKMSGTAKGTTTATGYATEMKMRMTPDEGMGEITQSIKGRLLGDCK